MKLITFLTIFLLLPVSVVSQVIDSQKNNEQMEAEQFNKQKIKIIWKGSKARYYKDGVKLNNNQLMQTLKKNTEAYKMAVGGPISRDLGIFLQLTGGFVTGWQIGKSLTKAPIKLSTIAVAVGAGAGGIILQMSGTKKINRAITIYDNNLSKISSTETRSSLRIVTNGNGLGIALQF